MPGQGGSTPGVWSFTLRHVNEPEWVVLVRGQSSKDARDKVQPNGWLIVRQHKVSDDPGAILGTRR